MADEECSEPRFVFEKTVIPGKHFFYFTSMVTLLMLPVNFVSSGP